MQEADAGGFVVRELRPDNRIYDVSGTRGFDGTSGVGGPMGAAQLGVMRALWFWEERETLLLGEASTGYRITAANCTRPVRANVAPVYAAPCSADLPRGTASSASAFAVFNAEGRRCPSGVSPLANATGGGSARETPASGDLGGVVANVISGKIFVADATASVVWRVDPFDATAPPEAFAGIPWSSGAAAVGASAASTQLRAP